ncbi:MAG TPA: TRAP transporter small permease [Candidatus Methylomirabilis sp.]|nr:TRAP transporter small permease [Candidatus Methylomirabilis sp.]HSC71464.1 TRAP transporter small permease [Candidatus Methylomirabilis sp.]
MKAGGAVPGLILRLGRWGGVLGEAAMAFMVVSIVYDVILRYGFLSPTIWALEVNTFLLVFLCVLPAADCLTAGIQIQITFLTDRLRPGVRDKLSPLGSAAGMLFCGLMTWKGLVMAYTAWEHNDRMSTTLGTPLVIPYLFLPVGFGLLGLTYAGRLAASLAGRHQDGNSNDPAPDAGHQI